MQAKVTHCHGKLLCPEEQSGQPGTLNSVNGQKTWQIFDAFSAGAHARSVKLNQIAPGPQYSTLPSIHVTAAANTHDQTEGDEGRQNGRTAIAQEWQRNARRRHESDDHSDVHDEVEKVNSDNTHHNEQTEVIARRLRVVDRPEDDKCQQAQA